MFSPLFFFSFVLWGVLQRQEELADSNYSFLNKGAYQRRGRAGYHCHCALCEVASWGRGGGVRVNDQYDGRPGSVVWAAALLSAVRPKHCEMK